MSAERSLAFLKHLTSYFLSVEVDKFLATKLAKSNEFGFSLGTFITREFQAFDLPKLEREKLFAAFFLSHVSNYLNNPKPNHFFNILRMLYSENISRVFEMDLIIQFQSICLRRLSQLISNDFFDDKMRAEIKRLTKDDSDGIDNLDPDYSDEIFYNEISEIVRNHERFQETSIFKEMSENTLDSSNPYLGLFNHFRKRKLNISDNSDLSHRGQSSPSLKSTAPVKKQRLSESRGILSSAEKSPRKSRAQTESEQEEPASENDEESNKENRSRSPAIELMEHNNNIDDDNTAREETSEKRKRISTLATLNNDTAGATPPTSPLKKLSLSPRKSPRSNTSEQANSSSSPPKSSVKITRRSTLTEKLQQEQKQQQSGVSSADERADENKIATRSRKKFLRNNLQLLEYTSESDFEELDFGETSLDKEKEKIKRLNAIKSKQTTTNDNRPKTSREAARENSESEDKPSKKKQVASPLKKAQGRKSENDSDKDVSMRKSSSTPARKSTATPAKKSNTHVYDSDSSSEEDKEKTRKSAMTSKKNKHFSRTRWTDQETLFLAVGVEIYGKGKWAVILNKYESKFNNRSCVDLKDRYRNLIKNGDISRFEKEARIYINTHGKQKGRIDESDD